MEVPLKLEMIWCGLQYSRDDGDSYKELVSPCLYKPFPLVLLCFA